MSFSQLLDSTQYFNAGNIFLRDIANDSGDWFTTQGSVYIRCKPWNENKATLSGMRVRHSQLLRIRAKPFDFYDIDIERARSPVTLPHTVGRLDRKSTRLNSGHVAISYAVFCLK